MTGNGAVLLNDAQRELEMDQSIKPQTVQSTTAVMCVNAPAYPAGMNIEDALVKYVDEVVDTYEGTTKRFASEDLDQCHLWKAGETERFTGPFKQPLANSILVIGNTANTHGTKDDLHPDPLSIA